MSNKILDVAYMDNIPKEHFLDTVILQASFKSFQVKYNK